MIRQLMIRWISNLQIERRIRNDVTLEKGSYATIVSGVREAVKK